MADHQETRGVENEKANLSRPVLKLSRDDVHPSAPVHGSTTPLVSATSKRVRMDWDEDGAPTSAEGSPKHQRAVQYAPDGTETRERVVSFDSSAESTPRKLSIKAKPPASSPQTPPRAPDLSLLDMKSSWDGSTPTGGSNMAGMLADPAKIAKEREKEERVRQARERLLEERQKKLEELREQQRMAQENREKQLEMRRRKIEDLRKRDLERRIAVEERRKMKEETERARRESILQKAEERVARYEAWKAGGRKGGRGHILGFGSATPRDICQPIERPRRSSSHSALQRRSPNGSDMDSVRPHRRAVSACSTVRRHVDSNQIGAYSETSSPTKHLSVSTSVLYSRRSQEFSSSNALHPPSRPPLASVDRTRSRATLKGKEDEKKPDKGEKNSVGDGEQAEKDKKKERVSLSLIHRLSTPKFAKKEQEAATKEVVVKKDNQAARQASSPRKAYSTGNLATTKKRSSLREKQSPTHAKEPVPRSVTSHDTHKSTTSTGNAPHPAPSISKLRPVSPLSTEAEKPIRAASPSRRGGSSSGRSTPLITPPASVTSTPSHGPSTSTPVSSDLGAATVLTPGMMSLSTSFADDGTTNSRPSVGSIQDISAEEYKARLAEKRRQARERADKEAEEERRKQEEARLAEEERLRQEEEEERRLEEEAGQARKLEEERLQKAIEAEEKRRKEETERQEQERRAKDEAERKARVEFERLEKEKQEKSRKEEEERQERKKKLEMIMKRVKVDTESPVRSDPATKFLSSPVTSSTTLASSLSSPAQDKERSLASTDASDEESSSLAVAEGSAVEVYSASMTTSFMLDFEGTDTVAGVSSPTSSLSGPKMSGLAVEAESDTLDGQDSSLNKDKALYSQEVSYENVQKVEEQKLQKVLGIEELQKKDELKIAEEERRLKEELERKARVVMSPAEREKQDRVRRDEEERLQRKKKLEMIMKRVKADTDNQSKIDTSTKSANIYSSVTHFSSSQSSPEEEQEKSVASSRDSDEDKPDQAVVEGSAVKVYGLSMTASFMEDFEDMDMTASTSSTASTVTQVASAGNIRDMQQASSYSEGHNFNTENTFSSTNSTPLKLEEKNSSPETKPKFRSPLLQQMAENTGSDSAEPKFKSPLLQSLLGRTKVGARMGLSASTGDVSSGNKVSSFDKEHKTMSPSHTSNTDLSRDSFWQEGTNGQILPTFKATGKTFEGYSATNGLDRRSGDAQFAMSSSKSSSESSPLEGTKLFTPVMSDSALGSSIGLQGDNLMSQSLIINGHGDYKGNGLEDSSISLFSVEDGVAKLSPLTHFEPLVETDKLEVTSASQGDNGQFGQLLDFDAPPLLVTSSEEVNTRSEMTDLLS